MSTRVCLEARCRLEILIGLDDALHERMTDHVAGCELRKGDAGHALQYLRCVLETGKLVFRQIDLRQITGNDST